MRKNLILVAVSVALLAASVGVAVLLRSPRPLRECGHPRDLWSEINPFRATHCCTSGRAVNELTMLFYAQKIYRDEKGAYATSFEQLTNDFSRRQADYTFHLEGDGTRWSVSVPGQSTLAGSYLLTSDGKLHFSATGPATTNDFVLRDLGAR